VAGLVLSLQVLPLGCVNWLLGGSEPWAQTFRITISTASCPTQGEELSSRTWKHWDPSLGTASWHVFAGSQVWGPRVQETLNHKNSTAFTAQGVKLLDGVCRHCNQQVEQPNPSDLPQPVQNSVLYLLTPLSDTFGGHPKSWMLAGHGTQNKGHVEQVVTCWAGYKLWATNIMPITQRRESSIVKAEKWVMKLYTRFQLSWSEEGWGSDPILRAHGQMLGHWAIPTPVVRNSNCNPVTTLPCQNTETISTERLQVIKISRAWLGLRYTNSNIRA
jgi:hypothetical protein